jgi:hypothetical protein
MTARRGEAMRIVLFVVGAAIGYGILHDLVTAHLCVEYFTIAHPPVFPTESPILLALGWGVIATWWVGLALGIGLASAARFGHLPKMGLAEVRRPIVILLLVSAAAASVAGAIGALLVSSGVTPMIGEWAVMIPSERHVAFSAAAWAHGASYGVGGLGDLVVIIRTFRGRVKMPAILPLGRDSGA